MKKTLIALVCMFVFLVPMAAPAAATEHAENCKTYQDGSGHDAKICVIVNDHSFYHWRQGLFRLENGYPHFICAWLDYVELYQGGILKEHLEGISGCNYTYQTNPQEQTDWNTGCPDSGDYQAKAYFKIKWTPAAGDSSTWKTLWSDHYYTAGC